MSTLIERFSAAEQAIISELDRRGYKVRVWDRAPDGQPGYRAEAHATGEDPVVVYGDSEKLALHLLVRAVEGVE